MKFQQFTATLTCAVFAFSALAADSKMKSAEYQGGTVAAMKEGTEVKYALGATDATFTTKGKTLTIPYTDIKSIEYGQKAGRRVGAAIGMSVLTGPVGLAMLASKKRKHFVTLSWGTENGPKEAAVFELPKDDIRVALTTLEARTGKTIEYTDEEARKYRGN